MPARDLRDEYKYDSSVVNIHSTLLLPVQDFPPSLPEADISFVDDPDIPVHLIWTMHCTSGFSTCLLFLICFILYVDDGVSTIVLFCRFAVLLPGGKHTGFFPGRQKKKKKEKRVPPGFFPRANLGTISPKLMKQTNCMCRPPPWHGVFSVTGITEFCSDEMYVCSVLLSSVCSVKHPGSLHSAATIPIGQDCAW